mmetsp:Transcript_15263/g.45215  ORF Transcript_15263/g.45215 Transcript_15263/m.45215 type:complete len:258 (-) Transcript_15263:3055-3828(-)
MCSALSLEMAAMPLGQWRSTVSSPSREGQRTTTPEAISQTTDLPMRVLGFLSPIDTCDPTGPGTMTPGKIRTSFISSMRLRTVAKSSMRKRKRSLATRERQVMRWGAPWVRITRQATSSPAVAAARSLSWSRRRMISTTGESAAQATTTPSRSFFSSMITRLPRALAGKLFALQAWQTTESRSSKLSSTSMSSSSPSKPMGFPDTAQHSWQVHWPARRKLESLSSMVRFLRLARACAWADVEWRCGRFFGGRPRPRA